MNFINNLSGHNLWYIPLIVAAVLMLFGFFTGFWRGWKSSLFYMIWNLVGFYVALFILDAIYDPTLKDMAKKWFTSVSDAVGPNSFSNFLDLFRGWLVLMLVLAVLSVWNFIAWIVHLFFKKRFTQHLKDNKAAGKSNVGSRLIGGLFGIIAVVPTTASAMASSTVISSNDQINKGVDKFVNAFTFGKVSQVSEDWEAIYELILSAQNAQDLGYITIGEIQDDKGNVILNVDALKRNSSTLVKMLNNPKSAQTAKNVISYQVEKQYEAFAKSDANYTREQHKLSDVKITNLISLLKNDPTNLSGVFFGLTNNGKANLKAIFDANAPKALADDQANGTQKLVDFLTTK